MSDARENREVTEAFNFFLNTPILFIEHRYEKICQTIENCPFIFIHIQTYLYLDDSTRYNEAKYIYIERKREKKERERYVCTYHCPFLSLSFSLSLDRHS